ncbi:MAG: sodium:solute symporter family protein [Gemmatimonadales bacterium]
MRALDWLVVAVYLAGTLVLGVWLARRGSRSLAEFFVGGRAIPWWLAGASMAATTFNVDTPLYVTGVVARRGIAGNWEWWSFAFTHVLMAVVLARLWRRATIMTDIELIELRYGGRPAAVLRGTRALLFAIPINCLGIGYGMLAMRKVLVSLGVLESLPLPGDPQLWAVAAIVLLVLVYAAAAGLWGVVATDFLQLALALLGAVLVAGYALHEVGGLGALRERLVQAGHGDALRLIPRPGDLALPFSTFLAYIGIQWWAYRGADGGGMFVQRLSSVRDERAAERAAGLFNVINYVVRTWPWVVVALAAMVVLPGLADPETAYPLMMLHYLPVGVLGLVLASLIAAFMSAVSTQINWGASYIVRDVYQRFVSHEAGERRLVLVGRAATILIAVLSAAGSLAMQDVGKIFRFIILVGNGSGTVLLLRWFWWRVNAWAEWAALLAAPLIALLATFVPGLQQWSFGAKLVLTAFGTLAIWLPVMLVTAAEPRAVLDAFYTRARPGGPGWRAVRERVGLEPSSALGRDFAEAGAMLMMVLGGMLAIGGIVVGSAAWALGAGATLLLGWGWRWRMKREGSEVRGETAT